ncbi:MAG: alpha/beta fold hydrolase [Myxococcales bacterium]|nr:alpha/beta fold hydrolase [Myxococcales bacterium]
MNLIPLVLLPRRYFAETRDGWSLALYRYEQRRPIPSQSPVICCHGLGSNRYNVDAPGKYSLARYLHQRGFDTWVLELRGAGNSRRRVGRLHRKTVTYDWNFDDHVHHDVPATLRLVRAETGHEDVHWVGHSMGGMVGYAFLTVAAQHHLRSLTAIGSPTFSGMRSNYLDWAVHLRGLLKILDRLPYRTSLRMLSPVVVLLRKQLTDLFANPENLDPWLMQQLIFLALSDLPTSLMRQFLDWYVAHDFRGWYGTHSYKENMQNIHVPVHIIAGSMDKLTPPHDLRYVYDHLASSDKQFTLFGKERGHTTDYGHVDLVLGKRAPDEVFPEVANWLLNR